MIVDDFKAIRERRDELYGHDEVAPEREITDVEKMRREADADWSGC